MGLRSFLAKRKKRKTAAAKIAAAFDHGTIGKNKMISMAKAEGILPYSDFREVPIITITGHVIDRHGNQAPNKFESSSTNRRRAMTLRRNERMYVRNYLKSIS